MKRKLEIAEKARALFNELGVGPVSLREISQALGISYGNLTYHFPKKEDLILLLYLDMMLAHRKVSLKFQTSDDLFKTMLLAPEETFSISMAYLFLFRDFAEIIRDFPMVAKVRKDTVAAGKTALKGVFSSLQAQKYFRKDLQEADIEYLMDLSGAMRTFFFLERSSSDFRPAKLTKLRHDYVVSVNRLLYPYLTLQGARYYRKIFKD